MDMMDNILCPLDPYNSYQTSCPSGYTSNQVAREIAKLHIKIARHAHPEVPAQSNISNSNSND